MSIIKETGKLLTDYFSNREIATGVWLLLLVSFALFKTQIRSALIGVIKAFFKWKIQTAIALSFTYFMAIVFFLNKIRFWTVEMLKETVLWFLLSGLVFLFTVNEEKLSFKSLIISGIGLIAIIEFIVNFYSFSLPVELVLIPIVTLLGATGVYLEYQKDIEENRRVKLFINWLLAGFSLFMIARTVIEIKNNITNIEISETIKSFLLSPILTTLFIPFLYLVLMIMTYEQMFVSFDMYFGENKKLKRFVRWQVFKTFHFKLIQLKTFFPIAMREFTVDSNRDEVLNIINDFKGTRQCKN